MGHENCVVGRASSGSRLKLHICADIWIRGGGLESNRAVGSSASRFRPKLSSRAENLIKKVRIKCLEKLDMSCAVGCAQSNRDPNCIVVSVFVFWKGLEQNLAVGSGACGFRPQLHIRVGRLSLVKFGENKRNPDMGRESLTYQNLVALVRIYTRESQESLCFDFHNPCPEFRGQYLVCPEFRDS